MAACVRAVTAVTVAFFASTSAWAQTGTAPPALDVSSASAPGPDGADDDGIVVTAQRREERLKDVPFTVTSLSGNQLSQSGVTGSRELGTVVPGLMINTTGASAQATIRGIGNTISGAGAEAPVALYIDGVYIATQYSGTFELANIESIQVLKGPQGTLFGRNATGGALLVTTSRPGSTWTGGISGSYARFNDRKISGYIGGPITDTLSIDIAGNYNRDEGYTEDVFRHTKTSETVSAAIRGKILFAPTSETSFLLIGDYSRTRDEASFAFQPLFPTSVEGAFLPVGRRDIALTYDPYGLSKGGGVSLEAKHDFGSVTVKSITAYRDTSNHAVTDSDRTAAPVTKIDTLYLDSYFTQELTAASSSRSAFQWILGGFYYKDTSRQTYHVNDPLINDARLLATAYAAFGEGTYAFTERFKLTAGIRYSNETRSMLSRRNTGSPLEAFREIKADAWTPRVSMIYAIDDVSNVYATYSKGFKSGVFSASTFNGLPVDPENVTAYELGYKLSSGGTNLSLSGFYYDYKNLQVTVLNAVGSQIVLNAANAQIYGLDADLSVRLSPEFRLRLAGAYTHSEYRDFRNAPFYTPRASGGNALTAGDASGNPLIRTPEFTASVGARFEKPVGRGKIDASVDYYYNSGFAWTVDNRVRQRSYSVINAQLGWSPDDSGVRISVFGKNLTNALYSSAVSVSGTATAAAYARPLSYGIGMSYHF